MNKSGIFFFIGTTAELIKVFPVMRQLDQEGMNYSIIASGQNPITSSELWDLTDRSHDAILLSNHPIRQSAFGLLLWFTKTLISGIPKCQKIFSQYSKTQRVMIVHGDTVSTLMGAILGKLSGARIFHIEAGLRSYNWLKPFPEEICRVLVSKLTSASFCPNDWAMGNLKNNPSLKINTLQNTLLDSMKHVVKSAGEPEIRRELGDKFFIFIMHRQENLFDPKFMDQMLDLVIAKSKELNCLFILHKPTKVALEKFQLMGKVTAAAGVVTAPRLSYVSFTKLLSGCEFIVTDGGSNQEESYYFGKPCCVLRSETERTEGLNHNVLLSKMDFQAIKNFLDNPYSWQKDALQLLESPSSIIAKSIRNLCTTT